MDFNFLNPLRWSKTTLLVLLGGFIFIWVAFLSTYSLLARYKLHREYNHLQKHTRQLQADTKKLKQKISKLKNDPALIKRLARENYGMKKPGETVYKIKVIR
jgi:cell division protein FtsB